MNRCLVSIVSICLVLSTVLTAAAAPVEGIFLSTSSAKKVVTEIKYGREKITADQLLVGQLSKKVDLLQQSNEVVLKENSGLLKDKSILTEQVGGYREVVKKTTDQLEECKKNTPSRLEWFGYGALTALVLGVLGAFAVAK